jgi:hypothetical protein
MLDDLLTSCALTLAAAGIVLVAVDNFAGPAAASAAPVAAAAPAEVVLLPTVVVTAHREVPLTPRTVATIR